MPVFNAAQYLSQAIDSILTQSFPDFELLIINDGSTDDSVEIIESFHDSRIKLIHNPGNIKLIKTLNRGLELIDSKYIARMDADDIATPDRLEKQFLYMEKHPEIGLLGSNYQTMGTNKNKIEKYPSIHDQIIINLFLNRKSFAHPTVMFRQSVFKENNLFYSSQHQHVEDYELWTRVARYTKLANLNDTLLHYRVQENQITQKYRAEIDSALPKIWNQQLTDFGLSASPDELILHAEMMSVNTFSHQLKSLDKWLKTILAHNLNYPYFNQILLAENLSKLYWQISKQKGLKDLWQYSKSDYNSYYHVSAATLLRLSLKKIIKGNL